MNPILLSPGAFVTDLAFGMGQLFVAYTIDNGTHLLGFKAPNYSIVSYSRFFPDASYPRLRGDWMVYKQAPLFQPTAFNLVDGSTRTFNGFVGGDPGVILNDDSTAIVWQTPEGAGDSRAYRVWAQPLDGDVPQDLGLVGAPDGLEALQADGRVLCRKDIGRVFTDVGSFLQEAGRLHLGQYGYGLGVSLTGWSEPRWLMGGHDTKDPRCDVYGETYAMTYWGGEGAFLVVAEEDELLELPVVPSMASPIVVPRIGRPMWDGFFVGSATSPQEAWRTTIPQNSLPGNCYLNVDDNIIYRKDGLPVAQYVAAEVDYFAMLDLVNAARLRQALLPVIPYWTRQRQTEQVPPGDWIGIELYRGKDETTDALYTRARIAAARCPQVAWITQVYTGNANNSLDLESVVVVAARLCIDCGNTIASFQFSGSGRRTGLQDHPDMAPLWQQFADGIPSAPSVVIVSSPSPSLPGPTFPVPVFPPPASVVEDFPLVLPYEVSMTLVKKALMVNGQLVRIDFSKPTPEPFFGFALASPGTDPRDPDCHFLLSKEPDGRIAVSPVNAPDLFLGADSTQFGSDLTRQLYIINKRGGYESWIGSRERAQDPPTIKIEFTNEGRYWLSVPLTIIDIPNP